MPDSLNGTARSSITKKIHTELADNSTETREEKEKEEVAKSKENCEAEKKERDLKARVENSVRGRIGKKAFREQGELFRMVYAEEMEGEMERRKATEAGDAEQ